MTPPPDPVPARPIFGGGEKLRQDSERPGGGGPKWPPGTFAEARARVLPQLEVLQAEVAETSTALRGARVVFEATVLPNYLANSYFPRDLFREVDIVPVGTRAATGPYETKKQAPEERPTKSYLLAADENAIGKLMSLYQSETA